MSEQLSHRLGLCILSLLTPTLAAFVPQPAFKTHTDLVALNVTVTNERGWVVRGLTQDSFAVMEDGTPQRITQFAGDALPLSLRVALDASESMTGRRFDFAREAVLQLVGGLGPDDEIGVFGFNDRAFNIQTWTRSRDRAMPVLEPAVQSEALIYAIGVDAPTEGPYAVDPVALRKLTDPTGGMTQIVRSDSAVVGAAERIGDELRQQYVIGFVSDRPKDGKFHHVRVTVDGCRKCAVRARLGYAADKPNPSS